MPGHPGSDLFSASNPQAVVEVLLQIFLGLADFGAEELGVLLDESLELGVLLVNLESGEHEFDGLAPDFFGRIFLFVFLDEVFLILARPELAFLLALLEGPRLHEFFFGHLL